MSTPWSALGLVCLYVLIVILGPQIMKNREAFNIKWLLVVYNFVLVMLCLYMLCEVRILFTVQ
jgi:elongation of very long chain fatty acids protein 4